MGKFFLRIESCVLRFKKHLSTLTQFQHETPKIYCEKALYQIS